VQVWRVVLMLWYVQCSFVGARNSQSEAMLRAEYIGRALGLNPSANERRAKKIVEIYDSDSSDLSAYIGRLFLDEHFVSFVTKLPRLIAIYHEKHLSPSKYLITIT
jgi:hypothetical protein